MLDGGRTSKSKQMFPINVQLSCSSAKAIIPRSLNFTLPAVMSALAQQPLARNWVLLNNFVTFSCFLLNKMGRWDTVWGGKRRKLFCPSQSWLLESNGLYMADCRAWVCWRICFLTLGVYNLVYDITHQTRARPFSYSFTTQRRDSYIARRIFPRPVCIISEF